MGKATSAVEAFTNFALLGIAGTMLWAYLAERTSSSARAQPVANESREVENWEAELSTGISTATAGPIRIVEFMDFECPYCAAFALRLDSLMTSYPEKISITFHHFPLRSHSLALQAAIAAECAAEQNAFWPFYRALFAQQRKLAILAFPTYAAEAGVADLNRFQSCSMLPADSFPRIRYGLDLGRRTGVRGTPTVWVNGLRLSRPPSLQELVEMVEDGLVNAAARR